TAMRSRMLMLPSRLTSAIQLSPVDVACPSLLRIVIRSRMFTRQFPSTSPGVASSRGCYRP
ncbi:MAG TPA: hypothetical protein VM223_24360, partial [Planctomycetota bacterium]|nr:hypothetical protein [Planctomycetota bacterium]